MTIKLFVRPKPPVSQSSENLEWSLYSYGGERIGGGVSAKQQLQEVVEQYNLEDVWLHFILPASDFSQQCATIPVKQTRYVQQALPYAIEESIAEDIDGMHLIVGEKLGKEQYPVLAIQKTRMQQWYDYANQLGFPLYGMYVDAELLNFSEQDNGAKVTVLVDEEDALVYCQGKICLRTPLQNLPLFLELANAELTDEIPLELLVNDSAKADCGVMLAQLEHIEHMRLKIEAFSSSPFEVLCAAFFGDHDSNNLCSPEFPSKTQSSKSGFRKWWPLAAVASLLFVVQLGFDVVEGYLYQNQADEYRQQSVALYKKLFPRERTIASPRRQLEGKLRNAANSTVATDFLVMLGEAGYQLSRQPKKQQMLLNNLQYSEKRGELAFEVSAPTLDDIDRYKQSLTQAGYQVGIGSAIKESNTVRGKLTVQGG